MGQEIQIKGKDGDFMGYLATPEGGSGPGVICIQEVFGVNTWMRNIADDLAAHGYVALAPDLFWRLEPGVQINGEGEEDFAKAFDLYGRFDVEKGIADIQDSINALRGNHGASDKIGTVGFCLGGFLAYMCSVRTDANANVGYYGVGIDTMLGEQGNMKSPLMLHVAVEDQFVPKDAQKKVHDGLAGNDKVTIYDYDGQDHAFARKGGDAYRKEAAELAESRTLDFFKQHLA